MLMLKGVGGKFPLEGGFIEVDYGITHFGTGLSKNYGITHFGVSVSREMGYATNIIL